MSKRKFCAHQIIEHGRWLILPNNLEYMISRIRWDINEEEHENACGSVVFYEGKRVYLS